jgi:hypothetical protein
MGFFGGKISSDVMKYILLTDIMIDPNPKP